ncbi:NAD-dependent epimerase/dehydratase family protein [Novosphingobium mangrovi (ex Huang et al. 2023)]|uniref:NAD-dependent epimerase/dehydratase family protein n=1 Tax=Novosphingobium mangrovi (ex Huang et al. 2023) TaxID=2976432 RepID=A0ABT2HZU4_9SPHN|nr:NAD-dependent epimerase/dehydratase family protein [Novosphingobium mangrovi (ex Huang et al. 2023)]MCT2398071.1 NAD-dependent epimerase/dehydratase family protein [Novosphingobium mangrovi (ex Huang et al. 2023)]
MTSPETSNGRSAIVTGGRGFIGTHLVDLLLQEGCSVISIDTVAPNHSPDPLLQEIQADLRDRSAMEAVFADNDIWCVYDLASFTEVDLDRTAYRRNVEATEAMVSYVSKRPGIKYIFYSTQFVHRVPDTLPSNDTDYRPIEAYGESKVLSEKEIYRVLPRDQFLILRPTYVWGPGLARFRDGLIKNLRKGRMLISSSRTLKRSYGYVETVARQTFEFSKLNFASLPHKAYYVTDAPIEMSTFSDHLIDAIGEGKYHKVPVPLIRLLGSVGNVMKRFGLPAPVNATQARELTTDFPVPSQRTFELTSAQTDYAVAAAKTVSWAGEAH